MTQPTPLDDLAPKVEPSPRSILGMQRVYGAGPADVTCKTCAHLHRFRKGNRVAWMKCSRAYVTASSATDWRSGWPACGLHTEAD